MTKVYQEHVIAIVDILGFTESLKNESSAEKILNILQTLKKGERGNSHMEKQIRGSQIHIKITPALTAFSDHVVLSVCLEELREPASLRNAVFEILNFSAQIAPAALQEGFLLRGGVTSGQLYHQDGVVFGQGLVDVHKLESKIAKYPRIVASSELVELFEKDRNCGTGERFLLDADGNYSLHYLPWMLHGLVLSECKVQQLRDTINANISKFKISRERKKLSKWKRFDERFCESLDMKKANPFLK